MNPIDIIIITYQRQKELKELLYNIQEIKYKNLYLNKVIIIDNDNSSSGSIDISKIQNEIDYKIDYFKSDENLGVARGRNLGIKKSEAEFLFFIDDDAEIKHPDCLKTFHEFMLLQPEDVAIFSLKILYFQNHEFQKNAFPHKNFNKYYIFSNFYTNYFIGAGHIIKRTCLLKTSLYPNDIFYGMEEYDLSYQMIKSGYKIMYTDSITILHKESPKGRQIKLEKSRSLWMNKSIIAFKYLPTHYFISTCFLWSLKFLADTKFNIKECIKTYSQIFRKLKSTEKNRLSLENISYLKSVEARLWY